MGLQEIYLIIHPKYLIHNQAIINKVIKGYLGILMGIKGNLLHP